MEAAQHYVVSINNETYAVSEDEVRFFEKHEDGELHELPNAPDDAGDRVWIKPLYDECVRGKFMGMLEKYVLGSCFYVRNTDGLLFPRDGWEIRMIAPGEYALMSDDSVE